MCMVKLAIFYQALSLSFSAIHTKSPFSSGTAQTVKGGFDPV